MKVLEQEITTATRADIEYLCITDIARYKSPERTDDLIRNGLRNCDTNEFLGTWEQLDNPGSKPVECDGFGKQAGPNPLNLIGEES